MRTFIFVIFLLLPCLAFGATNCRVVEYADHYEAICEGDKLPSAASAQVPGQRQASAAQAEEQEHSVTSGQAEESQQPLEVPPEQIVRNGLAKAYGESVLHSNHGRF